MSKLIALDDGHGMSTPGKRTPTLPGGMKSETGSFMHENEFNRAVVKYLDEELKRCGFRTLLVASGDDDVSLRDRVNKANNANADFYLSIHANAFDGILNDSAGGIETYAHFSYPKTVAHAKTIHKHLMKGTSMKDRGVKNGDWLYVCKNTTMSSALVELGFMDNAHDIKYLISDNYRKECARELAQALCEIYGVTYKPERISASPISTGGQYEVYINGQRVKSYSNYPKSIVVNVAPHEGLFRIEVDGTQVIALSNYPNEIRVNKN
jgi:N-acetylmuramoyl-L-alanine amidase